MYFIVAVRQRVRKDLFERAHKGCYGTEVLLDNASSDIKASTRAKWTKEASYSAKRNRQEEDEAVGLMIGIMEQ